MLKWRAAALGHRGGKDEQIQNGFYISSDYRVFVVADTCGKGTAAAGSLLALQAVKQLWQAGPTHKSDEPEIQDWLRKAISCAICANGL